MQVMDEIEVTAGLLDGRGELDLGRKGDFGEKRRFWARDVFGLLTFYFGGSLSENSFIGVDSQAKVVSGLSGC